MHSQSTGQEQSPTCCDHVFTMKINKNSPYHPAMQTQFSLEMSDHLCSPLPCQHQEQGSQGSNSAQEVFKVKIQCCLSDGEDKSLLVDAPCQYGRDSWLWVFSQTTGTKPFLCPLCHPAVGTSAAPVPSLPLLSSFVLYPLIYSSLFSRNTNFFKLKVKSDCFWSISPASLQDSRQLALQYCPCELSALQQLSQLT